LAQIDLFLNELLERKGSDLHLSAGVSPLVRKDGDLLPLDADPLSHDALRAMIQEILPARNRAEFDERNDTDFAYQIEGRGRFRVNAFMTSRGACAVARAIPTRVLTADELGLPEAVRRLCELEKGLVLVTGPTGSGKSTTLAAMIDLVNSTRPGHIITLEDPIEFVHEPKKCLVNQREIGVHTRSFATALRAALREDPNVILLGELRDLETTAIALETAETGHLVFGTLHTSSAVGTIDRLIDQFPAGQQDQVRTLLAASLRAVIAQVLVKRTAGGRAAAMEILIANQAIAANIREGKTHQLTSAIQIGMKQGMILLNDSLLKLVVEKTVDPLAALQKAIDKDDLLKKFQVAGVRMPAAAATGLGAVPGAGMGGGHTSGGSMAAGPDGRPGGSRAPAGAGGLRAGPVAAVGARKEAYARTSP
jgi:twitching motility protein PilT